MFPDINDAQDNWGDAEIRVENLYRARTNYYKTITKPAEWPFKRLLTWLMMQFSPLHCITHAHNTATAAAAIEHRGRRSGGRVEAAAAAAREAPIAAMPA